MLGQRELNRGWILLLLLILIYFLQVVFKIYDINKDGLILVEEFDVIVINFFFIDLFGVLDINR